MKRGIAVLLAGVLALGMSMTAMASESPSAGRYVELNADYIVVDEDSDVEIDYIYEDKDAEGYEASAELLEDTDNDILADAAGVDGSDYELAYLFDASGDDEDAYVIYIATGYDSVIVLHWNGSAWEEVDSDYDSETGKLSVTIDGYSPFAIYVSVTGDGTSTGSGTTDTTGSEDEDETETEGTSDATGEGTYVLYIVAIFALAGLAVSSKMRRA